MITRIQDADSNVAAFRLKGQIDKKDFDEVVIPEVEKLIDKIDKINLVYVIETDLSDFTAMAWLKDAQIGLQNLTKWNKAAIVSNKDAVRYFTDAFSKVMIGEFKGFEMHEEQKALDWAAGKIELND